MKKFIKLALCPFVLITLSSCGTLFSSTSTIVKFDSDPQGAQILLGSEVIGTTPFEHTFPNESFKNIILTTKKAGFENRSITLNKTVKMAALFDIIPVVTFLPSGLTSLLVDAVNGGLIEYSPDNYLINLNKSNKTAQIEYLLLQASKLQLEIAQGDGESLQTFYKGFLSQQMSWEEFQNQLRISRTQLLAATNAPDFYRAFNLSLRNQVL